MKSKPPYNVPGPSQRAGLLAVRDSERVIERVRDIIRRRNIFSEYLQTLPYVRDVFPSETNFVLVRVTDAGALYDFLLSKGRLSMP